MPQLQVTLPTTVAVLFVSCWCRIPGTFASGDDHVVRRAITGLVTVEVLAVVDYQLGEKLKTRGDEWARQYIANFYNGVNLRYQTIQDFDISVTLTGIYYCSSEDDCSFLRNNLNGLSVSGESTLKSLRRWLYTRRSSLPKHDVALLHTAYDICTGSPTCYNTVTGWAYIGTACAQADYRGFMWNCGMVEDDGSFAGIISASHELAHTLGANHDTGSCPSADGYIMGDRLGANGHYFSKCSISEMQAFIQRPASSCLFSGNGVTIKADTLFPGEFLSADGQCEMRLGKGSKSCWTDSRICAKLACSDPSKTSGELCKWKSAAADGTQCGSTSVVCFGGKCDARNED